MLPDRFAHVRDQVRLDAESGDAALDVAPERPRLAAGHVTVEQAAVVSLEQVKQHPTTLTAGRGDGDAASIGGRRVEPVHVAHTPKRSTQPPEEGDSAQATARWRHQTIFHAWVTVTVLEC